MSQTFLLFCFLYTIITITITITAISIIINSSGSGSFVSCVKKKNDFDYDVIVVGGGMAGIAAARDLVDFGSGLNVLVVEARNRIGGRLHSFHYNNNNDINNISFPFELGAGWIHQHDGNPLYDIAQLAQIETEPFIYGSQEIYQDSVKWTAAETSYYGIQYDNALTGADPYRAVGRSLYDAIDLGFMNDNDNGNWTRQIEFYLCIGMEAVIAENIEYFDSYKNDVLYYDGVDHTVPNGYIQILEYLLPGLNILYDSPVVSIDYSSPSSIQLHLRNSSTILTADKLVLTVPLGVLKDNSSASGGSGINFNPPLPANYLQAIKSVNMGVADKVVLIFGNKAIPLLQEHPVNLLFRVGKDPDPRYNDGIMHFYNDYHRRGQPALISFYEGDFARNLENESDDEIVRQHMIALREIIPDMPDPIDFIISRWLTDEFARGSYSDFGVGTTVEEYETFQIPLNDRIYFAGEHVAYPRNGYLDGAYTTGRLAASEILAKYAAMQE